MGWAKTCTSFLICFLEFKLAPQLVTTRVRLFTFREAPVFISNVETQFMHEGMELWTLFTSPKWLNTEFPSYVGRAWGFAPCFDSGEDGGPWLFVYFQSMKYRRPKSLVLSHPAEEFMLTTSLSNTLTGKNPSCAARVGNRCSYRTADSKLSNWMRDSPFV